MRPQSFVAGARGGAPSRSTACSKQTVAPTPANPGLYETGRTVSKWVAVLSVAVCMAATAPAMAQEPEFSPEEIEEMRVTLQPIMEALEHLHAARSFRCEFPEPSGDMLRTTIAGVTAEENIAELIGNVGRLQCARAQGSCRHVVHRADPRWHANVPHGLRQEGVQPVPTASPCGADAMVAVYSRNTQHLAEPIENQTRGQCVPIE